MANEEFADKVISALQKSQKAVDLSVQAAPEVQAQSDIIAFAGVNIPEGDGPTSGGFKDILILPNYGGTAATTPSQINFYWKSPTIPDQTGFDTNVRATIYNFAQTTGLGVTTPVLVFGGYDGTTNYLPSRNWGASGTGVTAKIFLDPFRGDITLDYLELNAGTASSTRQGNLWYDSPADKLRFAISTSTTSGFAKTVAFTDDIPGSVNMFFNWTDSFSNTSTPDAAQDTFNLVSGLGVTVFINTATDTATFGAAVRSLNDTITSTQFLIASPGVVASGTALSFLSDVSYVPSTRAMTLTSGSLTANIVNANVSGTAVTANFITANTQFTGFLSGNVSGTAVTANFITANTQFTGFLSGNVSGTAVTANFITANTQFAGLLSGNVSGNVSGTAVTANFVTANTQFTGFLSGNVTGTAVTANFVTANTQFTGFLSGNVTGTAVTANFITANTQISGFHSGNLSGTAVTANFITANTQFNGTLVGVASTASAVTIGAVVAGTYFPTFVNVNTAGLGLTLVTDANISFDANTNTLTTSTVAAFLSGNVSGTAVTANFVTANTQFTGFLSGNVTGTAVTANFVTANTQFTGFLSGNVTGTAVTANFITANTQISGFHSGNLSGTAVTANFVTANTQFTGFLSGNVTGTAVTANFITANTQFNGTLVGVASTASAVTIGAVVAGTYFPTFVNSSSAGLGLTLVTDANISFDANTNTLTVPTVAAFLSGNVSGTAVTANFVTANTQFTGFLSGNVTGTAVTANFITANTQISGFHSGNLSGTAVTANFITANTQFSGPLVGTATTAQNLNTVATGSNANQHFLLMSNTNGGSGVAVSSAGSGLTFAPNTNRLFAGSFQANGVVVGSASNTIDLLSAGSLTLGSASNAVIIPGNLTVQGTTITVDSTISTLQDPILVLGSAVGGTHLMSDDGKDRGVEFRWSTGAGNATTGFFGFDRSTSRFTFIPSGTNVGEVFSGNYGIIEANLSGNAVTASIIQATTGFFGNFTGTVTGTATTAASVVIGAVATGTYYPTFVNTSSASIGLTLVTDANISFDASTNVLTVPALSGNVSGTAITANFITANTQFTGFLSGNVSGTAVTANFITANTQFAGLLSGNVSGNVSGTAVTANFVTANTQFTGFLSGNVTGTAVTANFITANTQFTGFLSGNVTGTAVTANFITANTQITGFHSGNLSGTAVTANFITANTQFNGPLVGVASTASAVTIGAVIAGNYFPTFVNSSSAGLGLTLVTDANISFDANTNTLTVPAVSGNVSGTAVTANFVTANTQFTGFLSGNVTGTAVTANFITANTQITGFLSGNVTGTAVTANFITANTQFAGLLSGNVSGNVSGTAVTANFVTANTQFNGLLSGNVSGNVSGTAVTANFITANTQFNGTLAGVANTASAVTIGAVIAGNYFPTFVNSSSAGLGLSLVTDANISFDANTNVLTVPAVSGNVSGTAVTANFITANTQFTGFLSGNVTGTAVTANFVTANTQFTGFLSGNVTGTAVTANFITANTQFAGLLSGNVSGNVSGTAVTANFITANTQFTGFLSGNVSGTAVTANFITANTQISGFHSGNLSGTAVTANFITANTQFNGTLVGSVSGTATTAQNIIVGNAASQNAAHAILFSNPATSASGLAVSSNTSLSYNPSTNLLTTGLLNITSTTALSSGTYLTLTSNVTDNNSTSDFFIRALTSTSESKFSVDANGNLRATTKSFDIQHPTKPGMRLVYGVLEGPEHGVYHRGTVEGKGVVQINLPDYWHKLIGEKYTIQLTPWGNYNVHIVEKTQDYFTIRLVGDPISRAFKTIKVDYIVHGSRLDAPLKIEQDSQ